MFSVGIGCVLKWGEKSEESKRENAFPPSFWEVHELEVISKTDFSTANGVGHLLALISRMLLCNVPPCCHPTTMRLLSLESTILPSDFWAFAGDLLGGVLTAL